MQLFPRSIGAEVLVAGYAIVHFEQIADVEDTYIIGYSHSASWTKGLL